MAVPFLHDGVYIMKVSFIGCSVISLNTAIYLKSKNFDVISVYDCDVRLCVDTAVKIGCKARFDIEKAISDAEIIFISYAEDKIKQAVYEITKYNLTNKIVCVMSELCNSDMFDFFDTCFTVFPLKRLIKDEEADLSNITFIVEGSGVRYWNFIDELDDRNVSYRLTDASKKGAYFLAGEIVTEFTGTLCSLVIDMLENAGIYDKSFLSDMMLETAIDIFKTPKHVSYFDMPISSGSIAHINSHFEAIEKYGGINLKSLYKVVAYSILEHSELSKSEKEQLKRIVFKK